MRVEQLLPYQKPWIFVDKVLEFEPHDRIKTIKQITLTDFYLQGHFPEHSIFPGALQLEGVIQSAELLFLLSNGNSTSPSSFSITQVQTRFVKLVEPGDSIVFSITIENKSNQMLTLLAVGQVGEEEVMRANLKIEKDGFFF